MWVGDNRFFKGWKWVWRFDFEKIDSFWWRQSLHSSHLFHSLCLCVVGEGFCFRVVLRKIQVSAFQSDMSEFLQTNKLDIKLWQNPPKPATIIITTQNVTALKECLLLKWAHQNRIHSILFLFRSLVLLLHLQTLTFPFVNDELSDLVLYVFKGLGYHLVWSGFLVLLFNNGISGWY